VFDGDNLTLEDASEMAELREGDKRVDRGAGGDMGCRDDDDDEEEEEEEDDDAAKAVADGRIKASERSHLQAEKKQTEVNGKNEFQSIHCES
jgi:hypothetical protein